MNTVVQEGSALGGVKLYRVGSIFQIQGESWSCHYVSPPSNEEHHNEGIELSWDQGRDQDILFHHHKAARMHDDCYAVLNPDLGHHGHVEELQPVPKLEVQQVDCGLGGPEFVDTAEVCAHFGEALQMVVYHENHPHHHPQ